MRKDLKKIKPIKMKTGKIKASVAMPYLQPIANAKGLNLNKVSGFAQAVQIFLKLSEFELSLLKRKL